MAIMDNIYREVRQGGLAARIYKSGRVVFGAMVEAPQDHARIEVEVSSSLREARAFCEKIIAAINIEEGRYS